MGGAFDSSCLYLTAKLPQQTAIQTFKVINIQTQETSYQGFYQHNNSVCDTFMAVSGTYKEDLAH